MQFIALYARVSTQNQSTGLEAQVRALTAYCANHGFKDFKVYQDEGISGAKEHRPGLDALMAAVIKGEVTTVVVYSFSRFARSTKHLLSALETFNQRSIAFVSLSEALDTRTAAGKMIFTVLAAVAELERELVRERVKNGLVNARHKGKTLGRPKSTNTNLIKNLLTQGLTYRKIAELAECSHWAIREAVKAASSEKTQEDSTEQTALVG